MDKGSTLRDRALSRIPTISRDASDYLVAIAPYRKTLETCLPTDFTWFKCRAKHTVRKILKCYKERTNCLVDLHDEYGGILSENIDLPSLDYHGDNNVVLLAVESEAQALWNASQQAARSPLRPTNNYDTPNLNTIPEKRTKVTPKSNHPSTSAPPPYASPYSKVVSPGPSAHSKQNSEQFINPGGWQKQSLVPPGPPNLVKLESSDMPGKAPYRFSSQVKTEASPDSSRDSAMASEDRPSPMSFSAPTGAASVAFPNASQNRRLLKLLAEGSPELLESEVKESENLLEQIKSHLSNPLGQSSETQQWLQQIETLKQRNLNEPTIIGVVGNTGAGKSSVINAMLDEERLVPTNCMRACTAVVTEMSWNASLDENERYRAQIVFISPADWEKELKILHAEILDGNGRVSSDAYKADSEAGIAYAKIKAVYPKKTKEDLGKSSVEDLMREPTVLSVLGQTITIAEAESNRFYKILQRYVDSKEKTTEDKKPKKEMEFWPLIKVVKIYTKADALSTGAIIVDLPGVHDSNAARSAIAQNYIKMCTGLWIVAPITRAVDDKAAKSLLGESFKRQLKYDGTYSRVTFICSKTDDISIIEASESLGLQQEMSSKWDKSDQITLARTDLSAELRKLKETKDMYGEILNDTEDKLEIWERLEEDMDDGKTLYPPSAPLKRKRTSSSFKHRKRRESERGSEDDEYYTEDEMTQDQSQQEEAPSQGEPLTAESIHSKITELRDTKRQARLHRRDAEARILAITAELKVLRAEIDTIEAQMSAICIAGRNQYSKGAIQQDFAAGIKELDQENQIEANEADFNPDEDLRDYAEVARSLPVFCVSSRAYQKLCGRLQRDKSVPGFGTVQETEIPQLQAHCKKLTEAGRIITCRRFLNGFSQLTNSMSLWAAGNGRSTALTVVQMATEERFLHIKLTGLEKQLENVVQDCLEQMKKNLATHIYNKFDQVVSAAVATANATAAKWGAPMNRVDKAAGGLHWCTYKAVVRRDGCFNNGVLHDFNLQLTEPIIKQLGSGWETVFARRLPEVLRSLTTNCNKMLHTFHEDVESRVMKSGNGIAGLAMLGQQLENYQRIFQDLALKMLEVINENQREANREFTPAIARHLLSAYHYCAAESGTGSFLRMKAHLTDQINEHRNEMFHESTGEVKTHLTAMCRQVEEHMLNKADEVFVLMRQDYMMAITGSHVPEGYKMPRSEKNMKAKILQTIHEREEAAEKEERYEKGLDKEDSEDDEDEKEAKPETEVDELVNEPFHQRDDYIASEWDSYEDGVEDAEDQLLKEKFKMEEE